MKKEDKPSAKGSSYVEGEEDSNSITAQFHEIDTKAETTRKELESQERLLKIQKNYDITFRLFVFLVVVFVVGPEIRDLLYAWIASRGP